jgi:hypothetical protein
MNSFWLSTFGGLGHFPADDMQEMMWRASRGSFRLSSKINFVVVGAYAPWDGPGAALVLLSLVSLEEGNHDHQQDKEIGAGA